MSKVLVVCYSRTGNTRRLADAIVEATGWDLDPIVDVRNRSGLVGFLRSGFEAVGQRHTRLVPFRRNPRDYELVVVGSPVWGKSVSVPVRTYLAQHARDLRRVAFFVTYGGSGSEQALQQMEKLAGQSPRATIAVTQGQLIHRQHASAVARFVNELRAAPTRETPDLPLSTVRTAVRS